MDFDLLDRSPPVGLLALRYVEDVAHRVSMALRRSTQLTDPVDWMIRTHRRIHRSGDAKLLRLAYDVAERMHHGQMRKSGEPYITHPLAVAQILADLGMDTTTLVAALLHDTVEDTSYTMSQLSFDFGPEVAQLVDGVTKFEKIFYGDAAEVETIRKMITAANVDVRVLIIKIADRLHNMRTIDARSLASRVRIARATLDVLIPLCERLGVQALRRELEDSVLAAIEPERHAELRSWVAHRPEWTSYVDDVVRQATTVMRTSKIGARVVSRPHHLYSIWKDTFAKGHDRPYELPRIAIIVSGAENDCYTALGAVHNEWRPVTGRFKDFVASPKNNLYRSLHTTVIGPDSRAVEVLIRTEAMHRNAEYGIAAAYRFIPRGPGAHSARGRSQTESRVNSGEHLEWLRRLAQWQRSVVDPMRFLESLRCDLAEGQVHVFVNGTRLLLPAHSTPVDVAYALGSDIGDRCVAATVNGQLVFLSSPLVDGDVVEIHTANPAEVSDPTAVGPSPEWLTFVRTPHAQLQIEQRLRELGETDPANAPPMSYAARAHIGGRAIRLELRRRDRSLASELLLVSISEQLGYTDLETMLVAVADHVISAKDVAERLIEQVDNGLMGAAVTANPVARRP